MRSTIAALGLLTATTLIADDCCQPCEPCCVPKPKKCIDCECYTPAFYDLQCDWGAFFDVEFLYWYAGETNSSYALKVESKLRNELSDDEIVFAPNSYKHVDKSWDPGVRIGLGWNDSCDGWDTYLHWTYLRSKSANSTSVDPFTGIPDVNGFALMNPDQNPSFFSPFISVYPQLFTNISAKWKLSYNSIDLELGRKYWLSQCFNLRPFAAIRGSWIKRNFNTKSTYVASNVAATITQDAQYKNNYTARNWGVGLVGGFQPTWYFCSNFALYANIDAALLWGESKNKKSERYLDSGTSEKDYRTTSNSNFFQLMPILDTALGLRWEETWCCDRYRTTLDLGWEHHILFDQNHRNQDLDSFLVGDGVSSFVSGFRKYTEHTGNIGLGGLVLRLRWDF